MNNGKIKKLFVASSSSRKALVEAFKRELLAQAATFEVGLEIQPWYHDVAKPGSDILTALTNHCRGSRDDQIDASDFFAALLTDDDFQREGNGEIGQIEPSPRDNVNFELGLFLGGLGFDLRRCFMLCADVPKTALLSDLEGKTYIKLDKPRGNAPSDYDDAVQSAAAEVIRQIYDIKPHTAGGRESITARELLDREWPENRGWLLANSEVLVNRSQPMEVSTTDIAAQVDRNIRDGVTYRYFFHMPDFPTIVRLLHYVVTANPDSNGKPTKKPLSRAALEEHLNERIAPNFSINLLPKQGSLDFCVHNANYYNGSTCYVRDPSTETFVNLCQNLAAENIANKLKVLEKVVAEPPLTDPPRVFRRTETFDLYDADRTREKTALWDTIKKEFRAEWYPELDPILRKVCFGEDPK